LAPREKIPRSFRCEWCSEDVTELRGIDLYSDGALESLIRLASESATWTERPARYLVDKIEQLEEAGTWPKAIAGSPKSWERFCREVLGYEAEYIQKIREGVAILEGIGLANPTVGQALDVAERAEQFDGSEVPEQVYGKGKPGPGRGNKTDNDVIRFRQGNDPDYLTARIARDRPDIHQRMKDGEYRSVRAAAIEAGIIKVPTLLEQTQKLWRKMSDDERQSFLEWLEVKAWPLGALYATERLRTRKQAIQHVSTAAWQTVSQSWREGIKLVALLHALARKHHTMYRALAAIPELTSVS
jgi:hypothetical protein